MTRLFAFTVAMLLMVANLPARADGPFVGLTAGAGFPTNDTGLDALGPLDRDVDMGTASIVGGTAGYEFSDVQGFRLRTSVGVDYLGGLDGDVNYSQDLGHGYTGELHQRGDISSVSGSLNFEADIMQAAYRGDSFTLYPTIGGGIRLAHNMIDNAAIGGSIAKGDKSLGVECTGDSSNNAFGWHVQGGLGTDFGPNVSILALYRYTDRGDVETPENLSCAAHHNGNTVAAGNVKVPGEDIEIRTHEALASLRWRF